MNMSKIISFVLAISLVVNQPLTVLAGSQVGNDELKDIGNHKLRISHPVTTNSSEEDKNTAEKDHSGGKDGTHDVRQVAKVNEQTELLSHNDWLTDDDWRLLSLVTQGKSEEETKIPDHIRAGLRAYRDRRPKEHRTRGWNLDGSIDRRFRNHEKLNERAFSDIFSSSDLNEPIDTEFLTTQLMYSTGNKKAGKEGGAASGSDKSKKSEGERKSGQGESDKRGDQKSDKSQSKKEYSDIVSHSDWSGTVRILTGNIYDVLFVLGEDFLRRAYATLGVEEIPERSNTSVISVVLKFFLENYKAIKSLQGKIPYLDTLKKKLQDHKFNENAWSDGSFRNGKLLSSLEAEHVDVNNQIKSALSLKEEPDEKKNKVYAARILKHMNEIRSNYLKKLDDLKRLFWEKINSLDAPLSVPFTEKINKDLIGGDQDFVSLCQQFSYKKAASDLKHLEEIKSIFQKKSFQPEDGDALARKINVLTAEVSFEVEINGSHDKRYPKGEVIKKRLSFPVFLKNRDTVTFSSATNGAGEALQQLRGDIASDLENTNPQNTDLIQDVLNDPTNMHHSEKALYCNLQDVNGLQQIGRDISSKIAREIMEFQRMREKGKTLGKKGEEKKPVPPVTSILVKRISIDAYSTRSPCGDCEPICSDDWAKIYDGIFNVIEDDLLQQFGRAIPFLYDKKGSILKNIVFTQEEKDNPLGKKNLKTSLLTIGTPPKVWLSKTFMARKYNGGKFEKDSSMYVPYAPEKMSFFLSEPTLKNKSLLEEDLEAIQSGGDLSYYKKKYTKYDEELAQVDDKGEIARRLSNLATTFIKQINDYENFIPIQNQIAQAINDENARKRETAARKIQDALRAIKPNFIKARAPLLKKGGQDFERKNQEPLSHLQLSKKERDLEPLLMALMHDLKIPLTPEKLYDPKIREMLLEAAYQVQNQQSLGELKSKLSSVKPKQINNDDPLHHGWREIPIDSDHYDCLLRSILTGVEGEQWAFHEARTSRDVRDRLSTLLEQLINSADSSNALRRLNALEAMFRHFWARAQQESPEGDQLLKDFMKLLLQNERRREALIKERRKFHSLLGHQLADLYQQNQTQTVRNNIREMQDVLNRNAVLDFSENPQLLEDFRRMRPDELMAHMIRFPDVAQWLFHYINGAIFQHNRWEQQSSEDAGELLAQIFGRRILIHRASHFDSYLNENYQFGTLGWPELHVRHNDYGAGSDSGDGAGFGHYTLLRYEGEEVLNRLMSPHLLQGRNSLQPLISTQNKAKEKRSKSVPSYIMMDKNSGNVQIHHFF